MDEDALSARAAGLEIADATDTVDTVDSADTPVTPVLVAPAVAPVSTGTAPAAITRREPADYAGPGRTAATAGAVATGEAVNSPAVVNSAAPAS